MALPLPSCLTESHDCYFQSFHLPLYDVRFSTLHTSYIPRTYLHLKFAAEIESLPLVRSTSRPPFGFSPVVSLDPVAPDSLSRSFTVAVESHSGLGVSPFSL